MWNRCRLLCETSGWACGQQTPEYSELAPEQGKQSPPVVDGEESSRSEQHRDTAGAHARGSAAQTCLPARARTQGHLQDQGFPQCRSEEQPYELQSIMRNSYAV